MITLCQVVLIIAVVILQPVGQVQDDAQSAAVSDDIAVLVLVGEWFGDAYFPLEQEIGARGWTMKRIGVDIEYRGCYNKKRDIVLRSDILIQDLEDFSDYDCLIIPSGPQFRKFITNPEVLQFVRDAHANGLLIAAFCTGNFVVKAAGLDYLPEGEPLFPEKVTKVGERIILGPRGGGPPPGDGFESAPIKELCDTIALELQQKDRKTLFYTEDTYLGQKPPGKTPEVFAPGVISIEEGKEYKITFSPDLNEMFFTRRTPRGRNDRIWYSKFEDGRLTEPVLSSFGYDCTEMEAHFTPDGKRVYFLSFRPLPGENTLSNRPNVWFVDKTGDGWSEPQVVGSPLNDVMPVYFSFENDGTLYFTNSRPREIRTARLQNGEYTDFVRLPDEVNYLRDVAHPAVAPDGSYIIVDSCYLENDRLVGSLYLSFRKADGSWTTAVSMKETLKATDADIYASARVTPDCKYIFFERYERETDKADLYWVSSKIIEELRPKE
jgi:putative intracellular protease/amidase